MPVTSGPNPEADTCLKCRAAAPRLKPMSAIGILRLSRAAALQRKQTCSIEWGMPSIGVSAIQP